MDKVIIRDLKVDAIIGLYPWERVARQTLLFDLDLGTDIRQAAKDSDLRHAIDYSAVCVAVEELACQGQFTLIETLAENIASMVQERFQVSWLRVVVYKTDVLTNVGRVGVDIERGERQ